MMTTTEQKVKKAAYMRKWRKANPERSRELSRAGSAKHKAANYEARKAYFNEWQRNNTEKTKYYSIKFKFGLSRDEYDRLVADNNSSCCICGIRLKVPHVDHCHETDKIRGILCGKCNRGIGMFDDNPRLLLSARDYIIKNK